MATVRQKKAAEKVVENGGNVSKAMREAGYSPETAKNPKKLTKSKGWDALMEQYLDDKTLATVHKSLLTAHQLEHMVFPLSQTDKDIKELLESTGCKVRKIQHSETMTHCWFWSPNTKAQKDAVELAYKLKGRLTQKVKLTGDEDDPIRVILGKYGLPGGVDDTKDDGAVSRPPQDSV